MSRTKNTIRNLIWGGFYQVTILLLPFLVRTIILWKLGSQYLGLGSLFSSILNVLSMAELGFNSAIIFSMYGPIARNEHDKICALMAFYKKVYRIIGIVVLSLGLAIMPFLPYLIKGECPSDINLYILYAIYLSNSVLSYLLFAYKGALLTAHHRNDLTSKINLAVSLIQNGLQILVLYLWQNYYAYIILLPLFTILNNVANYCLVEKYYPQYESKGQLDSATKDGIKIQIKGLMVSKICGVLRNSLDSIILSMFVGLTAVAIYNNYYYILTAVHGFLTIIGVSMKAGIGNSIVKESKEKNYNDFKKFNFLYNWLAGWFACCMLCLYQPFMRIWVGDENLLLPLIMAVMFCIYFYVICMTDIRNVYTDAIGVWWQERGYCIVECIANLILNLVLGYFFGLFGIILATLITIVLINLIFRCRVLYKHYFTEEKSSLYLLRILLYFIITALTGFGCYCLCELLPFSGWLNLILRGILCMIVPNIVFVIVYHNDKSFIETKNLFVKKFFKR